MSKFDGHIKAPWHSHVYEAMFGDCVVHCYFRLTTEEYKKLSKDEKERTNKSTQALIDAAPDLLAELKACREFLASITEVPSSGDIGIRLTAIDKLIGEDGS